MANDIKILLATDCHLGYLERDPIRGNDSFKSFEEILQIATEQDVDMLLLGGDLFHENKPSRATLYKTMELMRTYCMGDRPCALQILSDQRVNFPRFGTANYMDPNYNIGLPIFSIHGNHDDPSGEHSLAALDLLSAANFVNYFGKAEHPDDITVAPVLIKKGTTQLALYGLGNIRDERLHRTFLKKKVEVLRPSESPDDWFNLFVIHQNRVKHGEYNYIPEHFVPSFMHLTLWGHEHKCEINPVDTTGTGRYITQPGSSVATALSEGESVRKHVGVLHIRGNKFKIETVPLTTVRPFRFRDIALGNFLEPEAREPEVEELLATQVEEMIKEVEDEHRAFMREHPGVANTISLPLIRLRVEYTGFASLSVQRFGQRFAKRVSNSRDILLFYRKRTTTRSTRRAVDVERLKPDELGPGSIEDLLSKFLTEAPDPPRLLVMNDFQKAMELFVDKGEKDAIKSMVEYKVKKHIGRQLHKQGFDKSLSQAASVLPSQASAAPSPAKPKRGSKSDKSSKALAFSQTSTTEKKSRATSKRKAASATSPSTAASPVKSKAAKRSTRGRGTKAAVEESDIEDDEEDEAVNSSPIELDDDSDDEYQASEATPPAKASSKRPKRAAASTSQRRTKQLLLKEAKIRAHEEYNEGDDEDEVAGSGSKGRRSTRTTKAKGRRRR
eukprot:m.245981 g.245981  ORF g.245981 m.245981 type:complete len:671 (+) comp15371_c0_seq6:409-2421(+)